MRKKRLFVAICFLILANMVFFTTIASAEYPEKEITLIGFADPGQTSDLLIRALIIGASKYLNQPIVIEYKPGSAGMVAASYIATVKPDGYTISACTSAAIVDGALMKKAPFIPLKSFTPITVFGMSEHTGTLVANDAPWNTFKEFLDYIKSNPGNVKIGMSIGSGMHVAMEVVAKQDALKWVKVPYPNAGAARTDVMGHHIDAVASGADWPRYVKSGQAKLLVTHGRTRSPNSPDVPNLIELGYNYANDTLHCIIGPAGLPKDVVAKLETAFAKGMETPEFKEVVEKAFVTPYYLNSKDLTNDLTARWPRTETLFKEFGIIKEAATQPR